MSESVISKPVLDIRRHDAVTVIAFPGGAVIEATDAPLDRSRGPSAGTIGALGSAPRSAAVE